MFTRTARLILAAVTLTTSSMALSRVVKQEEMRTKTQWVGNWLFDSRAQRVPFSFLYGGNPGGDLMKGWSRSVKTRKLDAARTEHTLTWIDPQTGLEVRCVAVEYLDFPVVEWTVYFKNSGRADTPILADIQALDVTFQRQIKEDFGLHYIDGDGVGSGYTPRLKSLGPGAKVQFSPGGGRPTNASFPYYNLEWNGQGVIIVVGWSGQWASSFNCMQTGDLLVRAGQELTHFKLHPGEEARSPMIVMQFWEGGDWIQAQNLWRRWMRVHNMPKPAGKDVTPILAGGTVGLGLPNYSIELANEKDQKYFIERYAEEKLNRNYWWMDIYFTSTNFWWKEDIYGPSGLYLARTWEADLKQFPIGLRAVRDYGHSNGMGLIAWYEPEHVWPGYKLFDEHPDWLLSAPPDPASRRAINQGMPLGNRRLLNLGNPDVVSWLTEHLSRTIEKEGIDVYRQDFNIEPLVFWRYSDPADRQGITENMYVQGYLRYWDGLLQRDPTLLIDTCASGGRRNDIETLRRAVPLWRSDDLGNPQIEQNHTYGLAFWIPYFGTGIKRTDTYAYRSALGSSLVTSWDVRDKKLDYCGLRRLTGEFWRVSPYYIEDYYPLTEFSPALNVWMAWQFNRPGKGDGMVQAFRRIEDEEPTKSLYLRGLDTVATYEVTDFDEGTAKIMSGKDLMRQGLRVEIKAKPGAVVFAYKKIR